MKRLRVLLDLELLEPDPARAKPRRNKIKTPKKQKKNGRDLADINRCEAQQIMWCSVLFI